MQKIIRSTLRLSRLVAPRVRDRVAGTTSMRQLYGSNLFAASPRYFFANPHENISKSSFEGPGFYMEQLLTGCLSLYSYYIESGNDAFLVDPMNET